ncbi:hypothetical protein K438DRAFT_1749822 [Mycena galopus ATCC 62051]|nr:hypothetical protein K438DRAFT_1749822 [Mycena galopus ATCC 62051]
MHKLSGTGWTVVCTIRLAPTDRENIGTRMWRQLHGMVPLSHDSFQLAKPQINIRDKYLRHDEKSRRFGNHPENWNKARQNDTLGSKGQMHLPLQGDAQDISPPTPHVSCKSKTKNTRIKLRKHGEEAHALPLKRLNTGDQEPGHDTYQKNLAVIIGGQLHANETADRFCRAVGTLSGQNIDPTKWKMTWNSKCHIVNYTTTLRDTGQNIGIVGFSLKSIKAVTFTEFMPALEASVQTEDSEVMYIVPWEEDEKHLPLDKQGSIAVVVDVESSKILSIVLINTLGQ